MSAVGVRPDGIARRVSTSASDPKRRCLRQGTTLGAPRDHRELRQRDRHRDCQQLPEGLARFSPKALRTSNRPGWSLAVLLVMRTFLYTIHPSSRALSLASFQARSRNSAWVIGTWLSSFVGKFFARSLGGSVRGYRQRLGSRLNSGLAQSASRSYPNNDLAGRSISGGSTRRVALTERTRSASTFLGLPLTRNSGKSSQRT